MVLSQFARKLNVIAYLTAENLALRHQLIVLKRSHNRPQLKECDRLFWKVLSNVWPSWRDSLVIIQPETVIGWQRRAFRFYWRCKSRSASRGRPRLDAEVKSLVLKLSLANPLWGAPRIHGELWNLGIEISERSVSGIIRRDSPKAPSQTWKTFVKITCQIGSLWISWLCRLSVSRCCLYWWFSAMLDGVLFTSMSPQIPPHNGLLNRSQKPFHGRDRRGLHRGIY